MTSPGKLMEKTKDFEDLFELYWEPLYAYAIKVLDDHNDAQDIIQDLFLQLWKKKDDISITTSVEAYLFKSAKYGIYSHIRSNTRRNSHYKEIAKDVDRVELYEKLLEKKEVSGFLQQRIDRLPEKMQQIVKLYLHDCLNIKEIAQIQSLSEQTVRNHLSEAIKKLRKGINSCDKLLVYSCSALFLILSNY